MDKWKNTIIAVIIVAFIYGGLPLIIQSYYSLHPEKRPSHYECPACNSTIPEEDYDEYLFAENVFDWDYLYDYAKETERLIIDNRFGDFSQLVAEIYALGYYEARYNSKDYSPIELEYSGEYEPEDLPGLRNEIENILLDMGIEF